ncbi:MAG TPA: hypothetical protein VLF19_11935 [Methylomirabilota bacterium]|nr:hypothetical protein [Methylomirabilota bacterium]
MPRRPRIVPLRPARRAAAESGLVEVYRCPRYEAVVVVSLLESEGIPAVQRSRIAHSVHPFSVGDQGEVVILVPSGEAARARRRLVRLA